MMGRRECHRLSNNCSIRHGTWFAAESVMQALTFDEAWVGAQQPEVAGVRSHGLDRFGHLRVEAMALEVDQEDVNAELLARRPRLDFRQVDAVLRQL